MVRSPEIIPCAFTCLSKLSLRGKFNSGLPTGSLYLTNFQSNRDYISKIIPFVDKMKGEFV